MLLEQDDDNNSSKNNSNDSILTNNTPGGANTAASTVTPGSTFLQDYDEYEQQQPSPWSQSPAPSPAIMDPEFNPFFQSPPDIDDEAFNPVSPESYDNTSVPFPPPISNVQSIVHIPLFHPYNSIDQLSTTVPQKPQTPQHHHLYTAHTNSTTTNNTSTNKHQQNNPIPIAILSFLAPIVPYPPVLLSSIASLAPFIATSFTNAIENAQMKKHGQFYNRKTNNGNASSTSTNNEAINRPKNFRRRSSKSSKLKKQRDDFQDECDENDEQFQRDDESGNDDDYLLHQQQQSQMDSTNTTPTAAPNSYAHEKRPDHLGSMSNFTRSSLETVTEQFDPAVHPKQTIAESTTDLSSLYSYGSSFSSVPADILQGNEPELFNASEMTSLPNVRKRSSQTSITSTGSSRRMSQGRSYKSLSPSSVAVMEGWGAVSPTTGLPISASIPPHSMCSDRKCVKHANLDLDTDNDLDTEYGSGITNENITPLTSSSNKPFLFKRRKHGRKSRYKRTNSGSSSKSLTRKFYDDDGFHYHRQQQLKSGVDRFLVAPKSSLLRLIIDGIPIHVL